MPSRTGGDAVVVGGGSSASVVAGRLAALMPVIPRANTNVPAVLVSEQIATTLLGEVAR
jgi:hypothetical protein